MAFSTLPNMSNNKPLFSRFSETRLELGKVIARDLISILDFRLAILDCESQNLRGFRRLNP